ncbi:UDP-N-acetylglucosamine 2-epimerase (non-hydrolyzing), partial [filamentous cyanobacterium CCP1]
PEAVSSGTAKLVGTHSEAIVQAASDLLSHPDAYSTMANAINPFGDGQASMRIVQAVKEYLGE